MVQVRSSITIETPPDPIWAIMCDPDLYPELADPTDRMLSVPDEEFGVGYVYREHGGVEPFKGESTWRVTEFEPMRRQIHVGDDGSMRFDLRIEFEPVDSGTRLTQTLELTPRWYLRPLAALLWPLMLRKRAQEAMDETVQNAKRMAEERQAKAEDPSTGGSSGTTPTLR